MPENISVIFRGEFANFRTSSTTDPYSIRFDSEHYTELLRQKGMQDGDIQTLTLEVCKENFFTGKRLKVLIIQEGVLSFCLRTRNSLITKGV